jgi:hypothetical protein
LEVTELRLGKIQKERVAVVEFGVNERCGNSVGSGVVEGVSYSPKVTDRRETRLRHRRDMM